MVKRKINAFQFNEERIDLDIIELIVIVSCIPSNFWKFPSFYL